MKKMKKLASILLAAIMVLAMAVPSMATATQPTSGHSITIKNAAPGHIYEAYQIFTGDVAEIDGKEVFSNVQWGKGIKEAGQTALLEQYPGVKEDGTSTYHPLEALMNAIAEGAKGDKNAAWLANFLAGDNEAKTSYLNEVAGTSTQATDEYVISDLNSGYYVIIDKVNNGVEGYDVYSSYIVQILGTDPEVTPKAEKPSVDKEVEDELVEGDDTENGWGESADHDINEQFRFKLTATLPANENFNFYESYQMIFNDVMSEGVTYDGGVEVQVYTLADGTKGEPIGKPLTLDSDYTVETGIAGIDAGDYAGGTTLKVTITDLTNNIGSGKLGNGYFIEVTYNAHLNEKARVAKPQGPEADPYTEGVANLNKVNLEYSNNPNVGGAGEHGKTPDDTVYVFTYELPSTKYQNKAEAGSELAGAGFTLYDSTGTKAIKLIDNGNGDYTVADEDAVLGTSDGVTIVEQMFSAEGSGKFNVKGLDVGTYVLKETTTPPGFNTCDDITVVVTATHKEGATDGASEVSVHMQTQLGKADPLKNVENNHVVNNSGATLPETGGIGTTIFYVLGSILVLGAVILLVTKRRMNVEK